MSNVDMINHPPHYTFGEKFEVIDVIDNWGITFGFCIGSAIKYIARAQYKGNRIEDLKKAKWYINYLMKCMKKDVTPTVRSPTSKYERIPKSDVVVDWNLDKHEGLAIRRLGEAIEWNRYSFCETQIFQCLTLARNQVALAIGKLRT